MRAFNCVRLIEKKKLGGVLSAGEIEAWVEALSAERVPEYQTAALLMAIRLVGMNFDETLALTNAMVASGERLAFTGFPVLADKHSTGGVGDKVTLILAPLLAACGLPVSMLSGRGLGFTGGTIDKFEALQGVSCNQDQPRMQAMLERFGWANAQASKRLVPADRILYRLRDVTATIDSIPLITASILSKKIAGGANRLCLDVKCGRSAFMQDLTAAKDLAHHLQVIGTMGGLTVGGLITHMDEPLGHAVGNYLELLESVHYLKELKNTPLMDLVLRLSAKMLVQGGVCAHSQAAETLLKARLEDGSALAKLTAYLRFTGGSEAAVDRLLQERFEDFPRVALTAVASGVVTAVNGRRIGDLLIELGAGRKTYRDVIDPMAGVLLNRHLGDRVDRGDVLAWVYGAGFEKQKDGFIAEFRRCYQFNGTTTPRDPAILHEF